MFRVAYVLLTVAGILACPFQCMAKIGGHSVPAEQPAACPCCQHRQDPADETDSGTNTAEPQPRGPAHPEGCDCQCFCNGALDTAQVPKLDLGEKGTLAAWLDASPAAQVDAGAYSPLSFHAGPPPPKIGSGRMIRLALASLLL
jgi:hypothetical protein